MRKNIKQSILKIKPYVPGKPIDEVKREFGLKNVIKLASNENPYGSSPKVLKAIEKELKNINRYPDSGCFYLRQELAKQLKVDPQQLIFGNGSDELILLAVRAFVGEGDEVVMAKPSFLMYSIDAQIEGAVIKAVPLKDFAYDLEAMKKAVTAKTKLIFLGNPDNPGGSYLTQKQVEKFLKGLRKDILIFIDEAYFEYVTEKDYVDSIALLKKHKNIFIARTFSKMYGLAGLRIGYGIANLELIDLIGRIREPFNINSLAQVAALACLKDKPYYAKIARDIKKQRAFLYAEFTKLGLSFSTTYTNFILLEVGKGATQKVKALMQRGVIVRDMSAWGFDKYLRISIGNESENKKLIHALTGALKEG